MAKGRYVSTCYLIPILTLKDNMLQAHICITMRRYDNLQRYNLPYAQAVFDLAYYRVNPYPFLSLAKEICPQLAGHRPTLTHAFIKLLESKNLLLRNYTQNIDGLEVLAGVNPDKMVECHGHFRTSSCVDCKSPFDGKKCHEDIANNVLPRCQKCGGLVKPDIVFFGESLPSRFATLFRGDMVLTDALIVMGTSLTVAPVNMIPQMLREINSSTPRVLFNMELVGDFTVGDFCGGDIFEPGDCDNSVKKLCKYLGWEQELEDLYAAAR